MGSTTSTTSTTGLSPEALAATIANAVAEGVALAMASLTVEVDAPALEVTPEVTETAKERRNRLAREARAKKAREAKAQAAKEKFFGAIKDPQNKADNAILAAWTRGHGVTPNGSAWKAVKDGKSNVKALREMNADDGTKAPSEAQVKAAQVRFHELTGKKHPAA